MTLAVDRDSERSADLAHTVVTETPNAFDPAAPRPRPPIKTGATRKRRKRNYDIVGERPQTVAVGGRVLHRRRLGHIYGIIGLVTTSSPEPRPVRPVSAIDVRGVGEALDDGDRDTTWWYDPSTGQVEMGVSEWIADEFGDDDEPEDRGLVPIESYGSRAAYDDMVTFASAVSDRPRRRPPATGAGGPRRVPPVPRHAARVRGSRRTVARPTPRPDPSSRAIDWLVNEGHVDPADAEVATTARDATASSVLESVGHTSGLRLDVTELPGRWADVEAAVDAGHEVTLLRDGEPWATITPT